MFGPPLNFRSNSSCPWVAQLVSGLIYVTERSLKLGFPTASLNNNLALQHTLTRWLVLQKARSHPAEAGLLLLVSIWFQVLFHLPHRDTFHLSLTVLVHYRSN